jgi:adenine phosphoribosyltransferase
MLLEAAYEGAPALRTGKHLTTVNEFTDQIPALRPGLLCEARDRLLALGPLEPTDKLLVEEDKGAILGAAVSLATGLPLAVARWYPYDLGQANPDLPSPAIEVPLDSEYFTGSLFVNGIDRNDRVTIVDDTISTGGTLAALISAVHKAGATISEVRVVVEKAATGGIERIQTQFGIPVRSVLRVDVDEKTRRARVVR